MKEQINEQLELLEKELNRLKDVTDYIDNTKKTAQEVVKELQDIQKRYTIYTDKIFELYKNSIEEIYSKNDKTLVENFNYYKKSTDELKRETEILVKETILQIENIGNQIDLTNREKIIKIKRLLEQYKNIVEATDNLVEKLGAIDFPTRLSTIDKNILEINSLLHNTKLSIEGKQLKNQEVLIQRLSQQDKEIKLLKTCTFVIGALVFINLLATTLLK